MAIKPQKHHAMVTKRLLNPPVTAPMRAAYSFLADPAIVMLACEPTMPTNWTSSSAPMEYQVYSLAWSPPKTLNAAAGNFACRPATPPIFARPNGIRISEIVITSTACTASTTAEAFNPPSTTKIATSSDDTM